MKRLWGFAAALVPLLALGSAAGVAAQEQTASNKVGTFDKTAIVLAYYRSELWAATLSAKRAEHNQAVKAGDTARAKELEQWGGTSQELAHQQLWGKAPIDNIVEALQPAFVEVKRTAGVDQIVVAPYDGKAATVDVTNALLDWLKTDETTRKMIVDMQKYNADHKDTGPDPK